MDDWVSWGTLRLVLLREIPEDETLRRQWNALVDRVDQPQVFYTYEWALAVYRAYHASLHPLLFWLTTTRERCAEWPLWRRMLLEKEASFLCATTGDYCDVLSSVEDRHEFIDEVLAGIRTLGIAAVSTRQSAGRFGHGFSDAAGRAEA